MSPNDRRIPLYSADNELRAWIPYRRAEQIAREGIGRLVRHKKGHVSRCILHRRSGDPKQVSVENYQGTRYSYRQKLDNNLRCWKLKKLGPGDELRPVFLRVLTDCLVTNEVAR